MRKRYAYVALLGIVLVCAVLIWRHFHSRQGLTSLALEECDPTAYIPCAPQEAFASIPVTETGAYLTYSSRWTPSPSGQHVWNANTLGLGGWSINFVEHYYKASRLLVSGDGSWRLTDSVALPSGEQVVPSYDGSVAYIFDSAGRNVRTVDGRLGTELLKISYDGAGRLAKVTGFMNGQQIQLSVLRDSSGRARSLEPVS